MGQVKIDVVGSFKPMMMSRNFSAMQHGHANAVMQAIYWLQSEVLPRAIHLDVSLQGQGLNPDDGFNVNLKSRSLPCPNCGQTARDNPVGGEYPCPICGIPVVHDDYLADGA